MQLAFIMPTDAQRQQIAKMHQHVSQFTPEQSAYFGHLIRSWRVAQSWHALPLTMKAIRRTLRERPGVAGQGAIK